MTRRIVLPPHWAMLAIAAELALWRWWPLSALPAAARFAGGAVILAGVGLAAWSIVWFRRKKTGLKPFSESTALVLEGPYRFTRNPIYVGFTLLLTGVALALGAVSSLIAVPLYVAIIHFRFILPEEAHMESAFGEQYLELKKRVRRWL
jgi:protein-S-isoprenylcysteine O-methyltransferase Ste14